jgi:hypothetical protein
VERSKNKKGVSERAPVDTGDQEKALELSFKELPFHVVG